VWEQVMTATERWRYRVTLGLVVPILLTALVGCGGNSQVRVPRASPTAGTKTVELAPGLRVDKAKLALPPFSVSTSYPLPSGVSSKTVVEDVQIDDLIENVAIERQEPALLTYADSGDWLASEEGEISQNKQSGTVVLSITDTVSDVVVGAEKDPQNSQADTAAVVTGAETRITRQPNHHNSTSTEAFDALLWLLWSPTQNRYKVCDTAAS
jgi:hypothetical protein